MLEFLSRLFDTEDFPARWHCGQWTDPHGWLHIGSDVAIFGAYMAIPAVLTFFAVKRRDIPFRRVFWLFIAFILFCGSGHLVEAVIFWEPVYRLSGVLKLGTALVSWGTVIALVPAVPQFLRLRSPETLERLIEERTRELEREKATLEAILRSLSSGVVVADAAGAVTLFNKAGADILGQRSIEQPVAEWSERYGLFALDGTTPIAPEDLPLARVLDGEAEATTDMIIQSPSAPDERVVTATARPVAGEGGFDGGVMVLNDITDRRHADQLFEMTVEASPSGVVVVDAKGEMVLVNSETERLFGYSRDELIGQPVEILIPDENRGNHPALRRELQSQPEARAIGTGRSSFARRKDGSTFPVEVGLNPIQTRDGTLVLRAIVDRTELVVEQDRLKQRSLELERSNRELEQFAYIASHDLREPLRMVSSYTALLEKHFKGELGERADQYIHYAVDGATRMQRMLDALLELSRVGSAGRAFAPVALGDAVADALKVVDREAIDTLHVGELPTVTGDAAELARVFQNLIGNAVKYRSETALEVSVHATREDTHWHVTVQDNGIGFEAKFAERIFLMFQRLHGRGEYEGSGIGLAIVAKIVEQHGGRIWAEGTPGQGATFHFTLAVAPELVNAPTDA